jgi:uncharacterized membrane protein
VRLLLAAALLTVLPGWAILRPTELEDQLERVVVSVAVSLALVTGVVALLMYAGWWSPARTVAILVIVIGFTVARQRRRGRS